MAGHRFPRTWTRRVTAWVIDDLGLVFDQGETFTEMQHGASARSPLAETLLLSLCNGGDSILTTDAEHRRGGYQAMLSPRYSMLAAGTRPLPYALGAADAYLDQVLNLLDSLDGGARLQTTAPTSVAISHVGSATVPRPNLPLAHPEEVKPGSRSVRHQQSAIGP